VPLSVVVTNDNARPCLAINRTARAANLACTVALGTTEHLTRH